MDGAATLVTVRSLSSGVAVGLIEFGVAINQKLVFS